MTKVEVLLLDHPMVPGESSAIEKGPWHYGADYIAVYFKGEPGKLKELVPVPFVITSGECWAYVCEIISVSENDKGMIAKQPDRTIYQEAALGVKCSFGERGGVFYPLMWVSTEWSLLRGLLNGYQKRLADRIALTKVHPLNPGLTQIGPGSELSGFCVKGSVKQLEVRVKLAGQAQPSDLPSFGATFGRRMFPQTDRSQGEVAEAVEILKSNSKVSDVWKGEGSLETSLDVGEIDASMGAVFRSGFTISGSKVLKSYRNI